VKITGGGEGIFLVLNSRPIPKTKKNLRTIKQCQRFVGNAGAQEVVKSPENRYLETMAGGETKKKKKKEVETVTEQDWKEQ